MNSVLGVLENFCMPNFYSILVKTELTYLSIVEFSFPKQPLKWFDCENNYGCSLYFVFWDLTIYIPIVLSAYAILFLILYECED